MPQHTIDEGVSQSIRTMTHFEDGDLIVEKKFDAQPHLDYAKQAREATAGQRWGEGRLVGHIPPAFYAQILAIHGRDERKAAVAKFFRDNPAFVMFDRYRK